MTNEAYSAAQFILELELPNKALTVGSCRSIEGGGVKADILTYRQSDGQRQFSRQLAAKPKFEDIKIQIGMAASEPLYGLIEDFFRGKGSRVNGAIIVGDFHFKERSRRAFYEALISEVAIPKLDGADRNAAYMGVTIVPEAIEYVHGDRSVQSDAPKTTKQKLWTPNNFAFRLDGFDDAVRRVTRIDGFTIKQQILEYHAGSGERGRGMVHTGPGVIRVPGMIEYPNIAVYLPEVDALPLIEHFKTYGVRHQAEQQRRTAAIELLDQQKEGLCTINMDGVDIASIVPDRADATSHDVKHVKVEFACESMRFSYSPEAIDKV